jgi:predicted ester cyclase
MNPNLSLLIQSLDAWNRRDLDTYQHLYAPSAVIYGLAPVPVDVPSALEGYKAFFAGFPDLHLEVLDTVCENTSTDGDGTIVVRFNITGTHEGAFQGIPATSKKINVGGITTLRYQKGHVVERWNILDQLTMLQQLGVMPAQ